ncbi:methyltransferase family protein [Algibacter sp. R77976]|uniref:methyltransferase family protein n=1 Tax=Algibacter sp. R77976 TaxID=3093873 RepID=UPI0037CAA8D9
MGYLISQLSLNKNLIIILIQLLGISISIWGIVAGGVTKFNIQPEVKSNELITRGPFSLIRNPMYIGIIVLFSPTIVNNPTSFSMLVFVLLIITLILKIYSEEQFLETKFGNQYLIYKAKTYRLIPYLY